MSLSHAILTALIERPATGAGLARRFERSIGYFWQATHQQIYRELGALEESGWIDSEPVKQGPGRQRAYRVLPAGRRELLRWIASDLPSRSVRDAVFVRLRAEAALGSGGLHEQIRREIDRERETIENYRMIEARDFAGDVDTREQRLHHLVLKSGIAFAALRVEMYREALEALAMPSRHPGSARRDAVAPRKRKRGREG